MISQAHIPILSALFGRDISKEMSALSAVYSAVGKATTPEMQVFITANLMGLPQFFESERGVAAIQLLVSEWMSESAGRIEQKA